MSQPGPESAGGAGDGPSPDDSWESILRAHRERIIAQALAKGWEAEALNAGHWRGRWFAFRGPLPSLRTIADIKREPREYGCHLYELEGAHLRWLLFDPCTHALEHGLHGQKQQETDADRAAKAAKRKIKEQLAAEEAEEKRRGRRPRRA